jgi:lipid A 3-O-deacylase
LRKNNGVIGAALLCSTIGQALILSGTRSTGLLIAQRWFARFFIGGAMLVGAEVAGADSVAVWLGSGNHADLAGVSIQWDARAPVREYDASRLTRHLELAASYIQGRARSEHNNDIAVVGATPVLRLERPQGNLTLFLEGGIGIRLLSDATLYDNRHFSTAFQFGELLGVGLRFGPRQIYEVGMRVEHISNGGIKEPNDGISFATIHWAYHYN